MPERILVEIKGKTPGEIARDLKTRIPHVFFINQVETAFRVVLGLLFGQLVCVLGYQIVGQDDASSIKVILASTIIFAVMIWLMRAAALRRLDPKAPPPDPEEEDDDTDDEL